MVYSCCSVGDVIKAEYNNKKAFGILKNELKKMSVSEPGSNKTESSLATPEQSESIKTEYTARLII